LVWWRENDGWLLSLWAEVAEMVVMATLWRRLWFSLMNVGLIGQAWLHCVEERKGHL
jgi:hypothetical protein